MHSCKGAFLLIASSFHSPYWMWSACLFKYRLLFTVFISYRLNQRPSKQRSVLNIAENSLRTDTKYLKPALSNTHAGTPWKLVKLPWSLRKSNFCGPTLTTGVLSVCQLSAPPRLHETALTATLEYKRALFRVKIRFTDISYIRWTNRTALKLLQKLFFLH